MKRIVCWLLTVMLLLTLAMPVAMAADERTSGAFTYRIKGNGTAAITGYDWASMKGQDIYIPRMLDGYTVTEIANEAFSELNFDENGVISEYLPELIAGSLVIPDTVVSIGEKAFMGISFNTKSISIPASVQYIGYGAFSALPGVEQFVVASGNTTYATIDGILYNKIQKELIACPMELKVAYKITSNGTETEHTCLPIPEGIKSIGDYAFFTYCFWRQDYISFPSTLERIGDYAFAYTLYFRTFEGYSGKRYGEPIIFPAGLSEIGVGAFYDANDGVNSKSAGVNIDLSNTNLTTIPAYAFYRCHFQRNGGILSWPSNLKEIGDSAFEEWFSGDFSPFPEKLESIGSRAFAESNGWSGFGDTLTFPVSLISIGDEAFFNWWGVKNVVLQEGLKEIGQSAFAVESEYVDVELFYDDLCSLETLVLPASLRSIGDNVCNRGQVTLEAPEGSYAAMWAAENGYITQNAGGEDTSWLNN